MTQEEMNKLAQQMADDIGSKMWKYSQKQAAKKMWPETATLAFGALAGVGAVWQLGWVGSPLMIWAGAYALLLYQHIHLLTLRFMNMHTLDFLLKQMEPLLKPATDKGEVK